MLVKLGAPGALSAVVLPPLLQSPGLVNRFLHPDVAPTVSTQHQVRSHGQIKPPTPQLTIPPTPPLAKLPSFHLSQLL